MPTFREQLTPGSLVKYVVWTAAQHRFPVTLKLKSGACFELRPNAIGRNGNNDYGVAYEVFVHKHLDLMQIPRKDDIHSIVDLGGNVGMSVVYWLTQYRNAEITVFEPHPAHGAQLRRNIRLNTANEDVCRLMPYAAGTKDAMMSLNDRGSASSLVTERRPGEPTFEVKVVDLFMLLGGRQIDIFKMDIEGGEYPLLEDPRFERLNIRHLIMEWHARPGRTDDAEWCRKRLVSFGYYIDAMHAEPGDTSFGIIAARRTLLSVSGTVPRRRDTNNGTKVFRGRRTQ